MHLSRAKLSSLNAEQYLETRSRFKLRNPIDWHAAAHFPPASREWWGAFQRI